MGFFTRAAMDALMKTTHPEINRRQCWNLPQPLHLPLAGAGGARHLCRRHRQRYHLDRL